MYYFVLPHWHWMYTTGGRERCTFVCSQICEPYFGFHLFLSSAPLPRFHPQVFDAYFYLCWTLQDAANFLLFCERNRSECDLPQGLYRTVSKGSNKKSKNLKKLQTRPSSEQIPWRQCCLRSYGRQCLMFTPLLHMPGGTCHPDLYQRIRREDWKITLRLLLRFVHCCTLSLRWSS